MFEDDDIGSELLGSVQRNLNAEKIEATRKEIAELRADINADIKKRKREEKASPKCPYCSGRFSAGAIKCRHCASDIKWCLVLGRSYPLKADQNIEHFVAQKTQEKKLREERRLIKQREQDSKQRLKRRKEAAAALLQEKKSTTLYKVLGYFFLFTLMAFPFGSIYLGTDFWTPFAIIIGMTVFFFVAAEWTNVQNAKLLKTKERALANLKRQEAKKTSLSAKKTSLSATGTPINCPICDLETHIVYFPYEQMTLCEHCSGAFVIPAGENYPTGEG